MVVEQMNAILGFSTLVIVETKEHVNIRCISNAARGFNCLYYAQYEWHDYENGDKRLNFKRVIFAGHSLVAHLTVCNEHVRKESTSN